MARRTTNEPTDRKTDEQTDGRTNRKAPISYGDAMTHLKTNPMRVASGQHPAVTTCLPNRSHRACLRLCIFMCEYGMFACLCSETACLRFCAFTRSGTFPVVECLSQTIDAGRTASTHGIKVWTGGLYQRHRSLDWLPPLMAPKLGLAAWWLGSVDGRP